ncbi:MAG TPA: DsbA family oxidoreductase [Burkholderiales bacterium]|nr:DsbA family oxidoreductase [Burkholderiales bacterium]
MSAPLTIEVVSDVICPWCYIGKRRLGKALVALEGEVSAEIRWLPFQLNPGMPPEGMPRAAYRAAKFGSIERSRELDARVAKEGKSEGIEFSFDRIERTPNTVAAHALVGLAQEQARADAVVDALFRAYFEDAQDIGDTETLAAIAQRCGVSGWPRREGATEVVALEQSMRGLGISAVPTFILDRKVGISGAHPPETLAAAIRETAAKR